MSVIEWGIHFYTGLEEVDRQHQRLIALVNRLNEAADGQPEILDGAFAELRDYARDHFSLEERLMEESGVDAELLAQHKRAHVLFGQKLTDLWQARSGRPERALRELLEFLNTWVYQHILLTDRRMAMEIHMKKGTEAPHNMFTHY